MPRTLAPEFPLRTYPSPDITEQVVVESITSELAQSKPIYPGTPHPDQINFSGFKLGKQNVNPNDPYFTLRFWVTDATNEDAWNFAIKYVYESVAHSIFVRSYRELKDNYVERVRGTALKTVYKLKPLTSGSGYIPNVNVSLIFDNTGTGGSGAAGLALINATGNVYDLVITNIGSAYTTAPTFTIPVPAGGVAATGTAYVQPSGAVLVKEEADLFPQDSEFFAQYFNVTRVYQTLPGPVLNDQEYDDVMDVVIPRTRQLNLNSAITIGTPRQEIKAKDNVQSEVGGFDSTYVDAVFGAYLLSFASQTNIQFPNVLDSVGAFVETQSSEGDDTDGFDPDALIVNAGSWTLSPRSTSQSSIVAMPDVNPVIKQKWGYNKKVMHYMFLLKAPVSAAALAAKLTSVAGGTVNAFPSFNPQTATLFAVGGRASVMAKAYAHYQYGINTCSDCSTSELGTNHGHGESHELGITIKAIRIPETIHGVINVSGFAGDTYNVDANATADAFLVSDAWTATASISAYVTPQTLSATTGDTAIPTSGLYLANPIDAAPYRFGWVKYHAEVLDAADL